MHGGIAAVHSVKVASEYEYFVSCKFLDFSWCTSSVVQGVVFIVLNSQFEPFLLQFRVFSRVKRHLLLSKDVFRVLAEEFSGKGYCCP